ncbi:MAG: type II secretion system protein GspN [Nitrospira sp.]|nr:type II secretion system protein GspN [Nitrospira sp.]
MVWPGKDLSAWKAPLLWMVFGCGLLFLSMALTFPYGALQTRIIGELQRATGMEVRAADWAIGFPAAIEWRQMSLTKTDWSPLQLGLVRAQMGLWRLLTGGVTLDLAAQIDEATATQGTVKLTVTAASWSMTGPVAMVGKIQKLDLSKVIRPYVARGTMTGEFTHRLDRTATAGPASFGEGTWKADAKDLLLDHIPVGNGRILALAFSSLSLSLACREQICEVTELKGDGIDGSFSGQGTVTMQQPIQQSQLALSLTVIPGVGFAAKAPGLGIPPLPPGTPFTFKVLGTFAQARVAL